MMLKMALVAPMLVMGRFLRATENVAAVRAYERAGFKTVGTMRQSERDANGGGWHDSLLMELLRGESLHALVREYLELDAFAGHLFVFTSRRRDRVKILYWDRDGFAVWSKRLEEGTYAVPFGDSDAERRQEITAQELGALLSGIDLSTAKRRKRYRRDSI